MACDQVCDGKVKSHGLVANSRAARYDGEPGIMTRLHIQRHGMILSMAASYRARKPARQRAGQRRTGGQ